ncbi:MAG: allophycocyanin subunit beta [Aphanocapsa feldmannii 277cV]|uniref:Allophycocyanin subunit beta n=2 Tax=Aphanocapsa feldmannii TaxID=192050 RepID=A0A524RLB3_9CHRO|nr:MAG: allophycocyanin subunit beta [Aphanocapsa feldmannii 288cV]TGG90836.1 MAG: allophycocyanin subunit beta [Aphanocapsa feldmannii 277cV]TGH22661.1 MAG: allophycocyanin subunit beta [Aphanocapsa feldmannii 277cI]
MNDAVATLIGQFDRLGRYLDREALRTIDGYYSEAELRLAAVEKINGEASAIVREASRRLFLENPDLLNPGGNAYTTRRLSACLRDMDYFLRYASYALVAGDNGILDNRVLAGLNETYKSLGVPTGPTSRSISLIVQVLEEMLIEDGVTPGDSIRAPFDHLVSGLVEDDVRNR